MAELITGFSAEVELETKELTADTNQYLTFVISDKVFGLAIPDVEEIIESGNVSDIPMTPDYIKGVINLRGQMVTVIDLSPRINQTKSDINKLSCIILINTRVGPGLLGLLVDEVHQIVGIPPDQVQPPPDTGEEIQADVIQALGRTEDGFILILNCNQLLSREQMDIVNQINKGEAE